MKRLVALVCQRSNNVPFVFEGAVRNNIDLIVIYSPDEVPPMHMPGVVGAVALPVFDAPTQALDGLQRWASTVRLDGILTQREEAMIWTAQAAETLGLPGLAIESAYAARSKAEMRRRFQAALCNVPGFAAIRDEHDLDACAELRYPVVAKPASAFGSAGVTLARDRNELLSAVREIARMNADRYARFSNFDGANYATVLVEEFIGGAEYVAECFARDGVPHVLAVAFKGNPQGPHFEETVYLTPPPLAPAIVRALSDEAKRGMLALGLDNGPGHCEMRLSVDGRPHILEIGARIGGSATSHFMVEASTGIDYLGLQFDFVTGVRNDLPLPGDPTPRRASSNWIIPLGGSGTLVDIQGLETVQQHPDFRRLLRFIQPGAHIRPYPHFDGFLGFILGTHRDTAAGLHFFEFLEHTVRTVWK